MDNKNSFNNCILLIYFNDSFLVSEKDFIKNIYQKYFKTIIFYSNYNKRILIFSIFIFKFEDLYLSLKFFRYSKKAFSRNLSRIYQ